MDKRDHWEEVYRARGPTQYSWYTPHLTSSIRMIREVSTPEARLIDVGGGASTLVDDLLDAGYRHLTVLDISGSALEHARARLGPRASRVSWVQADVTSAELESGRFDVWHDRAVFHFLTREPDRRAYVRTLEHALAPAGVVVMGTFSLRGPDRCSGLDVVRYDAGGLQRELGAGFELTASEELVHTTPSGASQDFVLCRFARRPSAGKAPA